MFKKTRIICCLCCVERERETGRMRGVKRANSTSNLLRGEGKGATQAARRPISEQWEGLLSRELHDAWPHTRRRCSCALLANARTSSLACVRRIFLRKNDTSNTLKKQTERESIIESKSRLRTHAGASNSHTARVRGSTQERHAAAQRRKLMHCCL